MEVLGVWDYTRQARDVVKAVKKRLANKSPTVQLLALTVLETLIKNCGDNVHQQIAEKDVLNEMVKIVRKKADMRVRDRVLVLLDSWQHAFGGSRGRYPQYYMAYHELQVYTLNIWCFFSLQSTKWCGILAPTLDCFSASFILSIEPFTAMSLRGQSSAILLLFSFLVFHFLTFVCQATVCWCSQ
jgi:hypothetical protein